jgi:UDP-2,4-diacetamido-2,4,6-trideoxy-beta-L-altropyranose hydrolase
MKVSLLTFGGSLIGTGHLFRCLNIAKWIRLVDDSVEISFHVLDTGIESQHKALNILKSRTSCQVSMHTNESLSNTCWDILIVDLLNTPVKIMNYLKGGSNFLVSIDNTSISRTFSDININPLYYTVGEFLISKNDYIGPQYHIISPEFYNTRSYFKNTVKNILIVQGGADPFNFTYKIILQLGFIKSKYKEIVLHVITGPAYSQSKSLLGFNNKKDNNIIFHKDVKNMSSFLQNIDLAISSIGVTAFEIASMGIPAIHITAIEKEVETGLALNRLGVSVFSGVHNKASQDFLQSNISNLIDNSALRKRMRASCLHFFNTSCSREMIEKILRK